MNSNKLQSLSAIALLCAVLLFSVSDARAFEVFYLRTFPDFTGCVVNDTAPAIHTVYVIATGLGLTATRFKLVMSPGATLTYVSETAYYPSTGNASTGIEICLGACKGGFTPLMEVRYQGYGTSADGWLVATAADGYAVPELRNCGGVIETLATSFYAYINTGASCEDGVSYFDPPSATPFCLPIPTERRTWGSIKALYQ